ncbi:MAG: putative DNA modification/repair radical SAM protein [Oscillospiraceae bacterium]|nr:putative DNA modification/repair radical SAM protein [Oscillospiraceae bacterium]
MELTQKLDILADSAKYDAACTSSGAGRAGEKGKLGNAVLGGICHSFSADGRCISLLKVLMSNYCVYDCQYCINRRSNDVPRAAFTPDELAELTIGFYRRNYIEGLFLSSGVMKNPDYTMELMCGALGLIRNKYGFNGYIHMKVIPGASPGLIALAGTLADRISVNMELPSEKSLALFAPDKDRKAIFRPMRQIRDGITENTKDLTVYKRAPTFAGAGQATQVIIGATPDTDLQIMRMAQGLYRKYKLRRVFYSAYVPVGTNALLPKASEQAVPLLREHRLYQSDFLIRFYGFDANEILTEQNPNLDPLLDPKCSWALNNLNFFPVEINTADRDELLRVPGIGPRSADKIVTARKMAGLDFEQLKKLRVVLRRAAYFITCRGKYMPGVKFDPGFIYHNLIADTRRNPGALPFGAGGEQLSMFPQARFFPEQEGMDIPRLSSGD